MQITSFPNKFYQSFPYQSRLKLGERIYNAFNNSQYKKAKADIKKSRDLTDHPGLPYLEAGNPNHPSILFLHGFGDTKESYLRQAMAFSKDFHVIVPDMPGFGPNPRLQSLTYNSGNMSDIVLDFINEIKLKDFHLAGNSMGGALSTFLTLKAPEKVKSLTLIDTAGFYFDHVHSVLDEFLAGNNLFLVDEPKDYDALLKRVFHKTPFVPKPVFEFLYEKIHQEKKWYEKLVYDLTHGLESVEHGHKNGLFLNHHIKDLTMPIQMIWGEQDSLFPLGTAEEIKKLKADIDLKIIKDCGHAPHYERTKEFNKLLKEFCHKNS